MRKQHAPTLMARFFIFIVVVGLIFLAGVFWWNDGISAIDKNDTTERSFVIDKGESISSIAGRLSAERFIRSKLVFYIYIKMNKLDSKIQAGNFQLKRSMNLSDVTQGLTVGTTDVWVTTLEGWRNEEIATKLSEDLGIPEQDFLSSAKEGYMFPDTYLLQKQSTAAAVTAIFIDNFNKHLTQSLKDEISRQGRKIEDIVTLASLLEREGRTDQDKPVIAGIILKRIKEGMPLDIDATLQYALGYQPSDHSWWKKSLTNEDKNIDSPYNTYLRQGLPPGPIANPGMSSITAAIYPQDSPYLYYLHDAQGQIHYGKTIEEHNANVAKYLTY